MNFREQFDGWLLVVCLSAAMTPVAKAQVSTQAAPAADTLPSAPVAAGGTVKGTVKAGNVPLPGVSVTATNTLTGKKFTTTTDVTGAYEMTIPQNGRYVVRAELAAFALSTKEALLNATSHSQQADFCDGPRLSRRRAGASVDSAIRHDKRRTKSRAAGCGQ